MTRNFLPACACVVAAAANFACASADTQDDSNAAALGGAPASTGAAGALAAGGSSSTAAHANGGALAAGGPMSFGAGGLASSPSSGGSLGAAGSMGFTGGAGPSAGGFTGASGSGNGGMGATGSGNGGMSATGGMSGAAGAGGAAGSAGSGGANPGSDDPCAGGMTGPASDASASRTPVRGYGGVQFTTSASTKITSLETTLIVPAKPTPGGTLFVWPGLEPLPGSANYNPVGTGVLQPVLTWGGTCAPNAPNNYADWWISGQYVNTLGNAPGFTGCKGGDGMTVPVGDSLHILMTLNGTTWSQSITDEASGKKVSFDFDLKGQAQNWVIFSIEAPSGKEPVSDVVFTGTVVTTADSDPVACTPSERGTNDYFSAPRTSQDGQHCCVAKLILRAQGVPASGPNN